MRRLLAGFVAGGVLTALLVTGATILTSESPASHVTEPTRPIIGISEIRVFDYPNLSTQVACDGSEVYPFDKARLEFDALIQKQGWPNLGDPSEHWTADITVRANGELQWDNRWDHQNMPPHQQQSGRFETTQANTYNIQDKPGVWTVEATVHGDVSGLEFETICTFLVE